MQLLIGIDGRALAAGAGSGRYTAELCQILDRELPEAKFIIFSKQPLTLPVDNSRWSQYRDDSFLGRHLPGFIWYLLRVGLLASRIGITVFWGPANFLPFALPRKIPALLTVLDVVHRVYPRSMGLNNRLAFSAAFAPSLQRADLISAISAGTALRLEKFGYPRPELIVRPNAASFFHPPNSAAITAMRQQLGITGPYLLSVSTLEPRKNLASLLDAYLGLVNNGELGGTALVLVGKSGWKNQELEKQISAAQAAGKQIICTGHVSDPLLPPLYAAAEAVIMPSLYEGFGLPVLEARMCGAQVIASDIPELREAGGPHATYCPPTVAGIQQAIRHLTPSPPLETEPPRREGEGSKLTQALLTLARQF